MASAAAESSTPSGHELITSEQLLFFRRLTYVAATLSPKNHSTASIITSGEFAAGENEEDVQRDQGDDDTAEDVGDDEQSEEEEMQPKWRVVENRPAENRSTPRILCSLATLALCNDKIQVVAVASGLSKAVLLKEPYVQPVIPGKAGKLTIAKNPRWSSDLAPPGDNEYTWFRDTGIRFIRITPMDGFVSPLGPNQPFYNHLRYLFAAVKKAADNPTIDGAKIAALMYLLRSSFPKMVDGASHHYPIMRVSKPNDKKKHDISLLNNPTTEFNYGGFLAISSTSINPPSIFNSARTRGWRVRHESWIQAICNSAIPLSPSLAKTSLHSLSEGFKLTDAASALVRFATEYFSTPADPKTLADLHLIFGSVFVWFFAGIKTLSSVYTEPEHQHLWSCLETKSFPELSAHDEDLFLWFELLACTGASLSEVVADKGDPVFRLYLSEIFRGEDNDSEMRIKLENCIQWLQLVTDHFISLDSLLLQQNIQTTFQNLQLDLLDVKFAEGERNTDMLGLDQFFESEMLKTEHLGRSDRMLLKQFILATQGSKKGLHVFGGTIHAETIIIILAVMVRKGYATALPKSVANIAKTIQLADLGTSKKCCPMCTVVILWARRTTDINFRLPTSHDLYLACDLPPWTPKEYAAQIIALAQRSIVGNVLVPKALALSEEYGRRRGSSPAKPDAEIKRTGFPVQNHMPGSAKDFF